MHGPRLRGGYNGAMAGTHETDFERGAEPADAQAQEPGERLALGRQSLPSLWRNREFTVVLFGQGVSALGDAVNVTALPLLVVLLTGSGTQMGIVGVLQTLPHLVLGLPAGALADRWDRRKVMLGCDLGRALLTALVPLSFWLGIPTMPVVYTVTAPIGALSVLFLAAYTAVVPSLVGRRQLGQANSYFQALASMGFVLGPGIAGVLVGWIGPGPTLAVDALTFAVSAATLLLITRPLRAEAAPKGGSLRREVMAGLAYIWHNRVLRASIAFWSFVSVAIAPIVPVLTYYVTQDLRLPASSLGIVISGWGGGSLLGSLVAARVTRGRLGLLMLCGNVVTGMLIFLHAFLSSVPAMAAVTTGIGVVDAVVLVSYLTLRSSQTPDALLGRVSSSARMLSFGLAPVGMLAGGVLLDAIGGAGTLMLMGVFVVLISPLFAFSGSLRGARDEG